MSKGTTPSQLRPRALAVASFGGHLVQLMRVMQQFAGHFDISYITTNQAAKPSDCESRFFTISDFSRSNPWVLVQTMVRCRRIIKAERPTAVVSTGAAPGLAAIIVARLMGIPTLWIDSIANVNRLSMCGRIASHIATRTLTQWPQLQSRRVQYVGTVL